MTAQAVGRHRPSRTPRSLLAALAIAALLLAAAGALISYLLWPTWPKSKMAFDAPAIPVTIAGVLFNVPPAAIRTAVQRHPGAHERIDLAFVWPSLSPPSAEDPPADKQPAGAETDATPAPAEQGRLFVTIAPLGTVLPPLVRLRTIYPRYIETEAQAGPGGLAIVPFRAGTPYEGEDLVYLAERPEEFFALCSRAAGALPGTCIQERALDGAEIALRFPRQWLDEWRDTAGGFDRLVERLHAHSS